LVFVQKRRECQDWEVIPGRGRELASKEKIIGYHFTMQSDKKGRVNKGGGSLSTKSYVLKIDSKGWGETSRMCPLGAFVLEKEVYQKRQGKDLPEEKRQK